MSGNTGWGGPGTPGGGYGPGGPGGYGPGGPGPWAHRYIPPAPKPGVIPLQPLSVGEIINGVFGTLKRYLKPVYVPLAVVAAVTAVPACVLAALAYGPLHTIATSSRDNPDYSPSNSQIAQLLTFGGLAFLLAALMFFSCYVVASTVCTTVLRHAVLGEKVTTRQVWAESLPHLWRVAGDNLLLGLASMLSIAVPIALAAGVGAVTGSAAAFGLLALLVFPGLGFAVYVSVRLVLVAPVLVLENERPIAALRRAWRLNEGAWWRSLGIPYLVNLIGSFAGQVILIPFAIVAVLAGMTTMPTGSTYQDGTDPTFPLGSIMVFYLVMSVAIAVVNLLTTPLAPLTNGLLYMDRRIRRESLDVALAAQVGVDLHRGPMPPMPPVPPVPPMPQDSPAEAEGEKPEDSASEDS
ncbi:DUF7544 domain-containing protein [Streptacidiphilus sp. PAMC 29251]